MLCANPKAMPLHLAEIGRFVGTHAILTLNRAGWHTAGNLSVPDRLPFFPCHSDLRS